MSSSLRIQMAKLRLESKNKSLSFVFSDLDDLQKMVETLGAKSPPVGAMLPEGYFLEIMSIHILIVSLLEYALKCIGKELKYWELIEYVRATSVLNDLEKDWLILLILRRHTVVHNFGHADDRLSRDTEKCIKVLKVVPGEGDSWLTPFTLQEHELCLRLIKKLIFLDIISGELTQDEREAFKECLATHLND